MSALISCSNFDTDAFACPLATISNDCSSGTPAFIIVANWRVKSVMSLVVIFLPVEKDFFFTFVTKMPCLRKVTVTMVSLPARSSPLTIFPDLSLPSHAKMTSFAVPAPTDLPTAVAIFVP